MARIGRWGEDMAVLLAGAAVLALAVPVCSEALAEASGLTIFDLTYLGYLFQSP